MFFDAVRAGIAATQCEARRLVAAESSGRPSARPAGGPCTLKKISLPELLLESGVSSRVHAMDPQRQKWPEMLLRVQRLYPRRHFGKKIIRIYEKKIQIACMFFYVRLM